MPMMDIGTQPRPVDLAHLACYTGGDAALNVEVLDLFRGQAKQLLENLGAALEGGDAKTWRETAHGIKGAARGIGAFAMADAAATVEQIDPAREPRPAAAALSALASKARAVEDFIGGYIGR